MAIVRGAILRSMTFAVLLTLGMVGCWMRRQDVRGHDCSELAKRYFRESRQHTMAEFGDYDVETQYAILICGIQYVHPPMLEWGELFAREGENVVHFLKTRLFEADDAPTIRDIVYVFTEMKRQETYDVAGDGELMRIMEDKADRISDPDWRQLVEQDMNEIRR